METVNGRKKTTWRLNRDFTLTGKERVDSSKLFELADVTTGFRGHSLKLSSRDVTLN